MEFDEIGMDSFFEDLNESLSVRSSSWSDKVPNQKILEALNILRDVLSLDPADADDPERLSDVRAAVQLISALDQSYGLTEVQIERVALLASNWGPVAAQAVAANRFKQEAMERLSSHDRVASSLRDLVSKENNLKEEYNEAERESHELQRQIKQLKEHAQGLVDKRGEVELERVGIVREAKNLKDQYDQLKVDAPELNRKLDEATRSLQIAETEWVALKDAMDAASSTFT